MGKRPRDHVAARKKSSAELTSALRDDERGGGVYPPLTKRGASTPAAGTGSCVAAKERLAREIEHHRKIAARAEIIWNWDSPAGCRRADRRAELFIEYALLKKGRKALELGCGTGVFLERVAPSGASIHGIDLSLDLLSRAKERLTRFSNVRLDCGNAEEMPYPDSYFDAVYGSSVLHHLDLERAFREIFRVLRPGGQMVFAEPNILNPQNALMFHFAPTKDYFGVSPDEMAFSRFHAQVLLEKIGYQSVSVSPFDFLHPSVPKSWVDSIARLGKKIEKIPLLREIAGSLLIRGTKV